jgi:hypothetical protein
MPDLPPNVHVIDYAYSAKGVFYHGTVSNLDGTPKSTWTISVGDKQTQLVQPIDQDTFTYLWSGLSNFAVFKRSAVTDSNTKMDFYHFQVIGVVGAKNGQPDIRTFLVAPTETDPQYKTWIEKLQVPVEKSAL